MYTYVCGTCEWRNLRFLGFVCSAITETKPLCANHLSHTNHLSISSLTTTSISYINHATYQYPLTCQSSLATTSISYINHATASICINLQTDRCFWCFWCLHAHIHNLYIDVHLRVWCLWMAESKIPGFCLCCYCRNQASTHQSWHISADVGSVRSHVHG